MIPSSCLLSAPPPSLAGCRREDFSYSALSLLQSSLVLLKVDHHDHRERDISTRPGNQDDAKKEEPSMPPRPSTSSSSSMAHRDLWHSMPSSERRALEEPSAYRSASSSRNASPSRFLPVPSISTTSANSSKTLPPAPESQARKRKPASLRSLIRRRPSGQLDHDRDHLAPDQPLQHHRSSSATSNLSPQPASSYYHQSSRSMPSSPAEFAQAGAMNRTNYPSYYSDASPTSPVSREQYSGYEYPQQQYQPQQQRATSAGSYEPSAPRARRTFPESSSTVSSLAALDSPERTRPHTWLSPTEPFEDASQFHLFVEATSGLPDGGLDNFNAFSPTSPPALQGSLFNSGSRTQQIPLPLQQNQQRSHSVSHYPSPTAYQSSQPNPIPQPPPRRPSEQYAAHPSHSHFSHSGWQSMGYDYIPSNAPPPAVQLLAPPPASQQSTLTPVINAINLELERLGLPGEDDDVPPEDELPDYAQSQAEMDMRKRIEAARRAKELEERWNHSRGRR